MVYGIFEIEKPQKRYLGNVPISSDLKFHKSFSSNVGDIREKNFYMKPPFSVMQPQIAKPGNRYLRICSKEFGYEVSQLQTDFLHEAPFFRDAASNWEAGQEVFAYCSKDFKYEVSLNLVKGLWRLYSLPPPPPPPEIFSGSIKRRNADDQHFLSFPSWFLRYWRQK